MNNPQIKYWKFEVIYTFETANSSSSIHFYRNEPPSNGSCSITPLNGTTNTSFTVLCSDWLDDDGIKDYSIHCILLFSS